MLLPPKRGGLAPRALAVLGRGAAGGMVEVPDGVANSMLQVVAGNSMRERERARD